MYCTESSERQTFNFLFWTCPFDEYSWILLGTCFLSLSILLRGQWIMVAAISMRQGIQPKQWNVALLTFLLITIVISCCYESIISSYLIIAPPFVVFNSLKNLIDDGYKVLDAYTVGAEEGWGKGIGACIKIPIRTQHR